MTKQQIGQSIARTDARAKVTGEAMYPGDFTMPNMLHAKILFSGRPHGRITSIDVAAAEAAPDVVAVITAKDVPVNQYGLQTPDQPVLCGPVSWQANSGNSERSNHQAVVRFTGDQVALVVAETESAAAHARDLIHVEYDSLPVLTDPFEALAPEAPLLHSHRQPNEIHPELCTEGNLICHHQIRRGDMEAGWAAADVIVEAEYHTSPQEHAYLQPEAGLAYIDQDDRLTVVVAGQWTQEDQRQIAHALDIPLERVRVIYPAIGGAFGGREDMSVQIVLALAVQHLEKIGIRRPVKIVWSREESILGHCKRHPMWFHCKWGGTRAGKLVAAEVKVVADGGAYCYTTNKVLGNTSMTSTGPYEIPNVKVDVDGVYTNNPPSGAFRGFGAPQGFFAAEMQMNKLAQALEMDPLELRLKNLLRDGSPSVVGTSLPGGVSLVEVTERCAQAAGWRATIQGWRKPAVSDGGKKLQANRRSGVGMAVSFKNIGFSFGYQEKCWAKVELQGQREIEQATLYIGSAEVGQGAHTVIHQMAAEALNLPLAQVRLTVSDTASSPGSSGSASASRMTFMAGNAVQGAVSAALGYWDTGERPAIAAYTYLAPPTTPFDPQTGYGFPNFAYGYVAQVVEVDVDVETGELRVRRVICANDVGRAINPNLVEGQIEGGITQASGWATCENFILADGQTMTPHLSTYLIPTIADAPHQIESIIIERPDPRGPWGARGMGEMPFIPFAPALAAAVHDATGVWFNELPLTPERVLRGLNGE